MIFVDGDSMNFRPSDLVASKLGMYAESSNMIFFILQNPKAHCHTQSQHNTLGPRKDKYGLAKCPVDGLQEMVNACWTPRQLLICYSQVLAKCP